MFELPAGFYLRADMGCAFREEVTGWETPFTTTQDTGKDDQQASWSRVILRPGRFPRAVTATDSVLKNSFARVREILGGYGFDLFDQFVEIVKTVEIHFLTRQV